MNRSSKNNKTRNAKATKKENSNFQKNAILSISTVKNKQKTNNFDKNLEKSNAEYLSNNSVKNTHPPEQKENNISNKVHTKTDKNYPSLSSKNAKKHKALTALIFIGGTIILGIIATLIGGKMQEGYIKPPAYPPDWFFSVIWPILYIMIGFASFLAYKSVEENKKRRGDVIWYSIHLFFNFLWPLFYFRLNLLIFSCIWLLFNVVTAIIVTYRYYRARICSGILFTLYSLWLIYAMYLSLGITMLNLM